MAEFMDKNKFTALDLENNSEVMATPMDNSGILVLVTGRIAFNDSELRNFSQSFVLKKKNLSYYCRNAMLAVSAVPNAAAPAAVETPAEEPVETKETPAPPPATKPPAPAAAQVAKPAPAAEPKAPAAPNKEEKAPKSAPPPKKEAAKAAKPTAKAEEKAPAAAPVKSSWAGVAGNAGDVKFKEVRPKVKKGADKGAASDPNAAGPAARKSGKGGKPGNGKDSGKPIPKQANGGGVFVLFVKNVVSDTTEDDFKAAFKKFGKVDKVEIKRRPNKEFATGYVTFTSPKTVDKVLEQTRGGMSFRGADLEMEAAKQSVQNQKPKGGNKGKGGSQRRNRGGKDRRDNGKSRREGSGGQRK